MNKIGLFLCMLLFLLSCKDDCIEPVVDPEPELNFASNESYNFFGYQLKDVNGFMRHQFIDTVHFVPGSVFVLEDQFKIEVFDQYIGYQTIGKRPFVFSDIIAQGSTVKVNAHRAGPDCWLVGLKYNRMWIGHFDYNSKQQINEWTFGSLPSQKVYDQNGVLKNLQFQFLYVSLARRAVDGFIVFLIGDYTEQQFDLLTIYLADDGTYKEIPLDATKGKARECRPWFNDETLIVQIDEDISRYYTHLSPKGDVLRHYSKGSIDGYPVSSYEWIDYFSLSGGAIKRLNMDGAEVWSAKNEAFTKTEDMQYIYSYIRNNETNIWEMSVKVTYTDFSEKETNFTLNIETGEVKFDAEK